MSQTAQATSENTNNEQQGQQTNSDNQTKKSTDSRKWVLLVLSLVMDGMGLVSYVFPGFGEWIDVVWAPVASIANFLLYRGWLGAAGATATLIEEGLPFTDFVPTFTLTWCIKYLPIFKKLQGGSK